MALTLGDNFSYQGAKPLDGRLKYDTLAAMKAVADATMYDGCMAYCAETDKTYQWKSSNTVDASTGKWKEFSSGGSGSYTAGDGITIENDVISADTMESTDMDDVVTPLPSVQSRYHKYSTDEQIVGEWIDGKPLYQKTIVKPMVDFTEEKAVQYEHDIQNVDKIFINSSATFFGYAYDKSGSSTSSQPYFSPANANFTSAMSLAWVNSTKYQLESGADRHTVTAVITFCYTKTTD